MRSTTRALIAAACVSIAALTSGCATYRTISTAEARTAKVFSGTRLNLLAMRGEEPVARQFKTSAPAHPAIALPLSLGLDIVMLPLTIPVATYEWVFP